MKLEQVQACTRPLELYQCQHCSFSTPFLVTSANHGKTCPFGEKIKAGLSITSKWLQCEDCNSSTSTSEHQCSTNHSTDGLNVTKPELDIILGKNKTHQEKWFKCAQCDFKTKYKYNIKKHHISKHTPDDKLVWYECAHCAQRMKLQYELKMHINKQHSSKSPCFKCQQCDFQTKYDKNLRRHFYNLHAAPDKPERKTSIESKWFECDQCKFKTTQKSYLHKHLTRQHPLKTEWFHCDKCDHKTTRKDNLRMHCLTKHSSDHLAKWFQCAHCDYKSKRKDSLRSHLTAKHFEQRYSGIFINI